MNRIWGRETLRFVDGWACRPGKPEDSEEEKAARGEGERGGGDGNVSASANVGGEDDVERGLAMTSTGIINEGVREKQR